MTHQEYIIKRKLNILDFAETLHNISDACRRLGISRQHYYDIKKALQEDGVDGLIEKSKRKPNVANRVPIEVEQKVLDYSLEYPVHGQIRAANELKRKGVTLSPGGVRSIWIRNKLNTKKLRLNRLEKWAAVNKGILTENQIQALEEKQEEKKAYGEIETHHSGYLFGQDTFYVGCIKGVGRIYQQTGIDTYSNFGFAKIYTDKNQTVAAEFLNDKVLPHYDNHNITLMRILTDRGTEYCGKKETHHYQLYLHINDIEHTKTKVRHPQTNGCTEKLNQIIFNEFYKVAFRKKVYTSIPDLQKDLDKYMEIYNYHRTNQGKRCKGRTPYETFMEGVKKYNILVHENNLPVVYNEAQGAELGPTKRSKAMARLAFEENENIIEVYH